MYALQRYGLPQVFAAAVYTAPIMTLYALSACTPTAFDVAMGAGVAAAARDDRDVVVYTPIDDLRLELKIGRAWLDESRTRFSSLDVDSDQGAVTISGHVDQLEDYVDALRLAWAQDATRSVGTTIELNRSDHDRQLANSIHMRLTADSRVREGRYTIEVFNNTVYVLGQSRSKAELNRVIRHARSAGSVDRIVSLARMDGGREST